eukprot:2051837-Alexandrium_andersonii.AAC.1
MPAAECQRLGACQHQAIGRARAQASSSSKWDLYCGRCPVSERGISRRDSPRRRAARSPLPPPSVRTPLNPEGAAALPRWQSGLRETQNRLRRSEPELRGPRNGLRIGPRSYRGVRSAPFLAQ